MPSSTTYCIRLSCSIPVQLRIVLVLHDMEELTTEQIAQILDLQPGTVRVRLHRGRLSVRKEMNRMLEASPSQATDQSEIGRSPRVNEARAGGAPPSAVNYSPISPSIWMAELSRAVAKRCAGTSRPAQLASHFSETCELPSTVAARWRFRAILPLPPVCARS